MQDCLFCKIASKEIPSNLVYESEKVVAFPDIHPAADTHILIVPKSHIGGIFDLEEDMGDIISEIYQVAKKLVKDYNLQDGSYRVVVNGGKAQQIPHLHFHFLGGKWKKFV